MKTISHLHRIAAGLILSVAAFSTPLQAADGAACKTIRLSDPGWTDITATNGVASVLLDALGMRLTSRRCRCRLVIRP